MSKSGTFAKFVYNENGLRVQKIIQPSETDTTNAVVTNYTLHSKNIVHMTQGSNELHFFYDAQNKPAVVVYNGTPYSYVKNLQGDIVAILDSTGSVVVQYKYDAWGKPFEPTGSMKDDLGKLNPFRYRGYVYDEETGLYYLQNRYYDSIVSRFLNSDDILCEKNLYCYTQNSPVCGFDSAGRETVDVVPNVYREYVFHLTQNDLILFNSYAQSERRTAEKAMKDFQDQKALVQDIASLIPFVDEVDDLFENKILTALGIGAERATDALSGLSYAEWDSICSLVTDAMVEGTYMENGIYSVYLLQAAGSLEMQIVVSGLETRPRVSHTKPISFTSVGEFYRCRDILQNSLGFEPSIVWVPGTKTYKKKIWE